MSTVTMQHAVGTTLRTMRHDQGRSLKHVAAAAFTTHSHLAYIERGIKQPGSELLWDICCALEVPLSTVLEQAITMLDHENQEATP